MLPRIESVARAPYDGPVRLQPRSKAAHGLHQSSAERRELVLHTWRHLCEDVTREHAVALEVAHGRGEHALRYARDAAFQIREPPSTSRHAFEAEDHRQTPLVSDTAQDLSELGAIMAGCFRDAAPTFGSSDCRHHSSSGGSETADARHRLADEAVGGGGKHGWAAGGRGEPADGRWPQPPRR